MVKRVRGSRTGRPIMMLLDLLGRRWVLRIVWELRDEPRRFRDLHTVIQQVQGQFHNFELVGQVLLGLPEPAYLHHPLVLHADGRRLAKRDLAPTLAAETLPYWVLNSAAWSPTNCTINICWASRQRRSMAARTRLKCA